MKAFPHSWHSKGFSPVWIRWCTTRFALWLKPFPHTLHVKGFCPGWLFWFLTELELRLYLSPDFWHFWSSSTLKLSGTRQSFTVTCLKSFFSLLILCLFNMFPFTQASPNSSPWGLTFWILPDFMNGFSASSHISVFGTSNCGFLVSPPETTNKIQMSAYSGLEKEQDQVINVRKYVTSVYIKWLHQRKEFPPCVISLPHTQSRIHWFMVFPALPFTSIRHPAHCLMPGKPSSDSSPGCVMNDVTIKTSYEGHQSLPRLASLP